MRVKVIHYEIAKAESLAVRLRREGIDAEAYTSLGTRGFRQLRENPPDAVVIDLMRMPSYGKAMGGMLRETKSTRAIPLVFLQGDPEKTARVRELLPDAQFAPLPRLPAAIARAVRKRNADPIVPQKDKPPAQKLQIRPGSKVWLIGAPEGFEKVLAPLPSGATVTRSGGGDVVLLVAGSAATLGRELPRATKVLPDSWLWVVWPKRSSKSPANIALGDIMNACAALDLTAYKTCAIDPTWSAVVVSRRRTARRGTRDSF
jgi:hypothetical protein